MNEQAKNGDRKTEDATHSFQERLKIAMEKAGGFSALMRMTGLSNSAISNYLKGRKPKIDIALRIAAACDVDAGWLILGQEHAAHVAGKAVTTPEASDMVEIPFFNIEASAGNGLIPSEWQNAEMIPFSGDMVRQLLGMVPKTIFMMRVQGDSMVPTIHPRDTLVVDYAPRRLTQGIYVMCAGESTLVKRLSVKDPRTYAIISDNPLYPSFDVPMAKTCWGNADAEAELKIVGRVVSVFHELV